MKVIFGTIVTVLIFVTINIIGIAGGWFDTWFSNEVEYVDQKIDDATNYETRKQVEDTCHAMISSYTTDKMVYEQYHGSEIEEERSWAEQAKMRANKTASTYNNFILENSFVWKENIPEDIKKELEYIY